MGGNDAAYGRELLIHATHAGRYQTIAASKASISLYMPFLLPTMPDSILPLPGFPIAIFRAMGPQRYSLPVRAHRVAKIMARDEWEAKPCCRPTYPSLANL